MRKNLAKHTAKKLPLAKRVLALCFALIFVCSCLLPAFANGTGAELETPGTEVVEAADPGAEPEPMDLYDEPAAVADEPAAMDDDFAVADEPEAMDNDFAMDDEPAAMDDQVEKPVVDDEPAAMDDQVEKPVVDDEPAAMDDQVEKPVEGDEPPVADDTPAKEGATKTTTDASGNTVYEYDTSGTTFPDDDAAALPEGDQMQMDAAFSIPTNIYHFWLKKMSSYDLEDIARDAETAEMTVEQYLAMYGTEKGCYHIMTAADGANLKDYQFANPTSNDDPEGNSRTFAGWYYTDELGDEQKFVFDEHLYVSEGTTVEVYAKWKDEAKPVTTTAEINALETTATVDGLAGVDALNVSRMDEDDEDDFVESFADKIDMEKNINLYAFDLTPVDKNGDTVQPDSGKKATVTIEGFDVTADDTVKVFHKADTGLEDLTSTASVDANGTLTFKTSSFSPFGVVVERGKTEEEKNLEKYQKWYKELSECDPSEYEALAEIYFADDGFVEYVKEQTKNQPMSAEEDLNAVSLFAATNQTTGYNLYIYTLIPNVAEGSSTDLDKVWNGMGVGTLYTTKAPSSYVNKYILNSSDTDIKSLITNQTIKLPTFPTISYTLNGVDYTCYPKGSSPEILKSNETVYTVDWIRVIRDNGANQGNNKKNPYVDANVATYHLDGRLKFSVENYCNVDFQLQDAGESDFTLVDPENYSKIVKKGYDAKNLKVPTKNDTTNYPLEKPVAGIKYKFDGWYLDKECKQKVDFSTYIVNEDVVFYGKYIPELQDVTITKQVTGWLGDHEKSFNFTLDFGTTNLSKVTCTYGNVEKQPIAEVLTLDNGKYTFQLKDGESLTLHNVPTGATFTVTEDLYEHYETHYKVFVTEEEPTGEGDLNQTASVTVSDKAQTVKFINHNTVEPDMGVLLDTLPYILILVVVVGGGVLLFLRKRKNDDDE